MQVRRGERQVLRERAVAAANANNRAHVAMPAPCRATPCTPSAPDGDLPGNAASDPRRIGRARVFDDPDELVTGHAREARIALKQLEIGAADSRGRHTDHAFIGGRGFRPIA